MKKQKHRIARNVLFTSFISMIVMALAGITVMAETAVDIKEGTYYIKAINGNANGQVLYWNEKESDQNISMMFESCGGSNADNEVWYITKNRNFDDYYGIYLARSYFGDKDRCPRIEIDNLTGHDQPYLTSTTGPHVFCGSFGNQDDAFRFYCQNDSTSSYTNLIIESRDDQYRFFRHKDVNLFSADLIYVKANTKHDTSDKLWELVPVNYERKMSQTAPSVKAKKHGRVRINCSKLRSKIKKTKVWKKAKYVEIQFSTDKEFLNNVKTKRIKKTAFKKMKARATLYKLKRNKTYYVRVRLLDKKRVGSNWSKAVKVRTKK